MTTIERLEKFAQSVYTSPSALSGELLTKSTVCGEGLLPRIEQILENALTKFTFPLRLIECIKR